MVWIFDDGMQVYGRMFSGLEASSDGGPLQVQLWMRVAGYCVRSWVPIYLGTVADYNMGICGCKFPGLIGLSDGV